MSIMNEDLIVSSWENWNKTSYTRCSNFEHRVLFHANPDFEDVYLSDEVEKYHGAVKHIAGEVTELIGEELMNLWKE